MTETNETETDAKPRKAPVLNVNQLTVSADYLRTNYQITVGDDVTLEDVLRPGFWAHHTTKLKRGDLVDVVSEDLELDAQLRVIRIGEGLVHTRLRFVGNARDQDADALAGMEEAEDLPELPAGYKVAFNEEYQWHVYDVNGLVVSQGWDEKAEAHDAAVVHYAEANGTGTEE